MKRKICVITGTRADYGIWYSVMKAINASGTLELYIIATSMHLMDEFGYTVKEIERDGFNVFRKIDVSYKEDSGMSMAISIGKALSGFAKTFQELKPDFVLVLGDRGEMLAAAIAANYLNIPVAHLHGGEVSGHVDGVLRHAITKMSHLHFPATKNAGNRLIKLGEEKWRIFVVGAPALDRILNEKLPDESLLSEKYHVKRSDPFSVLLQHPVLMEEDRAAEQMRTSLEALKAVKLKTLIIYPNADAGGKRIIKVLHGYAGKALFQSVKSLPHLEYLGLLRMAAVLVGNSSSGLIEAPSFRLPVVNIGNRQEGRERSANVIDVTHSKKAIIRAIKKAIYDVDFRAKVGHCDNSYGDGRSAQRIVRIIESARLNSRLLRKRITY